MITQLYVCSANIFYIESIYERVSDLEKKMNKDRKKLVEHSLENSNKYERSVNGVRIHFS